MIASPEDLLLSSVTIRRRSQATQIRAELATKRRLKKTVMSSSAEILLRDPSADEYPDVAEGKQPNQWWVYAPEALSHYGLIVSIKWHYAYLDRVTGQWDAANAVTAMERYHPWRLEDPKKDALDDSARKAWDALPEQNRGWLKISGCVPLRNIIAIDEMGDDIFEGTHLYVPFHPTQGPFEGGGFWRRLTTCSHYDGDFELLPEKRIVKFSPELRLLD